MSVIIVFPDGTDWFRANWVFRQLAQDVSDRYSGDSEVCKALAVAKVVGALDLEKMNDGLRRRVMAALTAVAMGITQGTGRRHDANEHALYCEAVSELAKCLKGHASPG